VSPLPVRAYALAAKGFGALPPGFGEFRYANWVYRHHLQRLPHGSTAFAELMGGARVQLDLSEWPQAQAFLLRRYAPELVRFIVARLPEGSVFLDIGAHVGLVSLQVAGLAYPKEISIHAFEPHPDAARRLRFNQGLNPLLRIRVNECALTERPGSVTLDLRTHAVASERGPGGDTAAVSASTVDDFLDAAGIGYADVVKIDVEGHELAVLRGASRALGEGRIGHIVVEMLDAHHARLGTSALDVLAFMSTHGYARRPLPRVGARRYRIRGSEPRTSGDVVFAPARRFENSTIPRR
jgi:FkbM family methyltransferase